MAVDMTPAVIAGTAPLPAIKIRHASVPVVYAEAVKHLAACRTIDEAMLGEDAADVLAAWAAMYRDQTADREARALKLHAYQRIGQLAQEIRPQKARMGGKAGPHSLLREHGFNKAKASTVLAVARMPAQKFAEVVASPRPPSPSVLVHQHLRPNPEWAQLSNRLAQSLSGMRQVAAKDIAERLSAQETGSAYTMCREMLFWLVPFHDALKAKRGEEKVP